MRQDLAKCQVMARSRVPYPRKSLFTRYSDRLLELKYTYTKADFGVSSQKKALVLAMATCPL